MASHIIEPNFGSERNDSTYITGHIIKEIEKRKQIPVHNGLLWQEMESAIQTIIQSPSFDYNEFEKGLDANISSKQTLIDFQLADANGQSYPGAEVFNEHLRNGDFEELARYNINELKTLDQLKEKYDWLDIQTTNKENEERFVVKDPLDNYTTIYGGNSVEDIAKMVSHEMRPTMEAEMQIELMDERHTPEAVKELNEYLLRPRRNVSHDERILTGEERGKVYDLLTEKATAQDILTHVKQHTLHAFHNHVINGEPYKEPEPAKKKMKVNFHRPTTSNELSR